MAGLGEDGLDESESGEAGRGPALRSPGAGGRRARWPAAGAVAVLLLAGGSAWALAGPGPGTPAAPAVARPSDATASLPATPSGTPSQAPSAVPADTPAVTPPAGPPPSPGPATPPATTRPAAAPAATRSPSPKGGATTRRPDPATVSPQPCGTTCGTGHAVENPNCVRSPETGQILTCDKVQTGTPLPRPSASAVTPGNVPG